MIKFKIHPKICEGKWCKFGNVLEKCQNYRFFEIFCDISNKMKDNLGQECVKGRLLSLQGKIGTIVSDFPGKMTFFPVLTLLFNLSLPKIWLSYPHKKYIFEMSNNTAIRKKSFIMLSLRL